MELKPAWMAIVLAITNVAMMIKCFMVITRPIINETG
jgi:hypothetical protein